MKYPEDFLNKIICGDCLPLMKLIPDKAIDLVLCDPPYGVTACEWDCVVPFKDLWAEYLRIIKDNGTFVFTATQPFTTVLISSNIKMFKYCWVWDKCLPTGHLNAKFMPMKQHEDIVVFSKNGKFNPQMRNGKFRKKGSSGASECYGKYQSIESWNDTYYPTSILRFSNANQSAKTHPTQKPIELFKYFVLTYSDENDTVLDPFMGSGTTARACKDLGRNFIGFEINPDYCKIAEERLRQEVMF